MLKTVPELLVELGDALRAKRIAQGLSQLEASERAGVPYRTWRRLEGRGEGSLRNLVHAAVALRCENNLSLLFPSPAAASMDELLAQQASSAQRTPRRRVARRRRSPA